MEKQEMRPEYEYAQPVAVICPECGSERVSDPDSENLRDCHECGIWWEVPNP